MNTIALIPLIRTHRWAILTLVCHLLLFSLVNQWLEPHPDMLDHWVWSRIPALSFYEHPPMVAWSFKFVTLIFGESQQALEIGAQLFNIAILALAYGIAYRLLGLPTALIYLLMLESAPYFSSGSVFMHIDQPFMLFWLLNCGALCRFVQTQDRKWLIWIGVFAGFGALSKYITILFYLGLMLFFALSKDFRKYLWQPWIYLAGAISLVIFSPVLIWNYQNQWVSFLFQFKRGLSGAPLGANFILFSLGHLFLFSFIWALWGLGRLWQIRRQSWNMHDPLNALLVISVVPISFFTLMSFRGSIADPHWANVSYFGFLLWVAREAVKVYQEVNFVKLQKMLKISLAINALVLILFLIHFKSPLLDLNQYQLKYFSSLYAKNIPLETIKKLRVLDEQVPLSEKDFNARLASLLNPEEMAKYSPFIVKTARNTDGDPANQFAGWEETTDQILALLKSKNLPLPDYIISKEYQLSSALSFYFPNHPFPHSMQKPERNQWSPVDEVKQKNTLVVCHYASCRRLLKYTKEQFGRDHQLIGEITVNGNHRILRELEIHWLTTSPLETPLSNSPSNSQNKGSSTP